MGSQIDNNTLLALGSLTQRGLWNGAEIISQVLGSGNPAQNRIINALCLISQRGDFSAASAALNNTYYIDRFSVGWSNVSANKQHISTNQPSALFGSKSLRLTATSAHASGYLLINQSVENPLDLVGKEITLSAWVKSSNPNARLRAYWTEGGATFRSTKHTGDGTWQRLTLTFTINSTVGTTGHLNVMAITYSDSETGVSIAIGDYIEATGWMLNVGPMAMPVCLAGVTQEGELALCQRYFERVDSSYMAQEICAIDGPSRRYIDFSVPFKTTKRVLGTVTGSSPTLVSSYSPTAGQIAIYQTGAEGLFTISNTWTFSYSPMLNKLHVRMIGSANNSISGTALVGQLALGSGVGFSVDAEI